MKQIRNSNPRKDLTGITFGYLTPMYYIKGGKWHCKCQCGNEVNIDTRSLNNGHTQSCGCLLKKINSINNTKDMLGYENDGIRVINREGSDKRGSAMWKCECKYCGNIFITKGSHIREGVINSCGCIHSNNEKMITKLFLNNNIEFATQYTFSDLFGINGGKLRFDFAVFNNGQLSHLIEYNGKQHYEKPEGAWENSFET